MFFTSVHAQDKPNVIFILADDLGAGDLHCTGHPYAKTPHLDKLAKSGIQFNRAYMSAAWCAPSRYALMSGQYPARDFNDSKNLKPTEANITQVLHDAGYATAHFGKWHMNWGLKYMQTPGDFGIDDHFTSNHNGKGVTWTSKQKKDPHWREKTTDAYVDKAINFMKNNKASKNTKPFYVNLWIFPTHSLINPTEEMLKVYDGLKVDMKDFSKQQQEFLKYVAQFGDINKAMQAYCADVTAMDAVLGRLFKYLKDADLADDTIIVFSSDNGPGPLTPQIGSKSLEERYKKKPTLLNSVGSAKNYSDRKASFHEGGIRVPFIVSYPKKFSKGKVDNETIIAGVDWLPTIASLCGADFTSDKVDGIDVKAAFTGGEVTRSKPLFWSEKVNAVVMDGKWKAVKMKNEFKLYDIEKDPAELNDLSASQPKLAKKYKQALVDWQRSLKN